MIFVHKYTAKVPASKLFYMFISAMYVLRHHNRFNKTNELNIEQTKRLIEVINMTRKSENENQLKRIAIMFKTTRDFFYIKKISILPTHTSKIKL